MEVISFQRQKVSEWDVINWQVSVNKMSRSSILSEWISFEFLIWAENVRLIKQKQIAETRKLILGNLSVLGLRERLRYVMNFDINQYSLQIYLKNVHMERKFSKVDIKAHALYRSNTLAEGLYIESISIQRSWKEMFQ